MTNVVEIQGKQCDLEKAFPLLIGDFRALMRKGIDVSELGTDMLKNLDFLEYIVKKVNPEITTQDFDKLTAEQFAKVSEVVKTLSVKMSEEQNAPLDNG